MFKDDLGDRMKGLERVETARAFDKTLPVYARIDGRGFSRFTQGLSRPYDARMSGAMVDTARALVERTGARLGYTQSDEISLVWLCDPGCPDQELLFGGKVQKLASVLAGLTTAAFTHAVASHPDPDFAAYTARLPHFDARVFQMPSLDEAANAFIWREADARRNAVSMAARAHFSHAALQNKSVSQMLTMLESIDVAFDAYPGYFRQGTYVKKESCLRTLTEAERAEIPESRRPDPEQRVVRNRVITSDVTRLSQREDRLAFVFGDEILATTRTATNA